MRKITMKCMHQFFRISSLIMSVLVLILFLTMLIYTKFIMPSSLLPVMKIKKHSGNWHLNLTPPEKLSFLSPYREIWINEKNNCSCNIGAPLPLTKTYDQKDMLAIEKRRKIQFEQHRKRNESPLKNIIIAQPNSPLSYPIHGAEVMPLQSIVIPGLSVFAIEREEYTVKLTVTQGVFNTIAEVPQGVLKGLGDKELTITSPHLELINAVLKYITYTSKKYHIDTVDIVSFQFEEHVAEFPIIIRQPPMPRLFDPGPDNDISSLVTITTKTFLRYHKLRILIDSIRRFYPNMMIIIADDSEVPEKIEGPHIEQYIMPFAKGWFAGRNLAASQVTTKYLLWVDEDFLFTKDTKVEKLVEVLENTNLDVVGASVNGNQFQFKLWYEKGNDDDGDCLFSKPGSFHALDGFPNCHLTSVVVNFFLAKTSKILSVGFDPRLARVAHPEFFIDGLGRLLVGSCNDVIVSHQTTMSPSNNTLKAIEEKYAKYRRRAQWETDLKHRLHYFKNHLKCYSKI
ncbi:beta-1,4 N-acetylgalactosaminyltransferase 2-like isoform X3 [Rhincodon typus]|uniref:beta-1,4 N-acetylgalactosaminyltransferase 2-like isoform X3 n=1 Tax=Rhincodon typus TaxID=259920 RepID=UPI00202E8ED8|nr:beta-1,4 N-acetylgalactosaminyltransferase 2-like isoform X3 [Rhincodon typus]